jgi:hypothetical protein
MTCMLAGECGILWTQETHPPDTTTDLRLQQQNTIAVKLFTLDPNSSSK